MLDILCEALQSILRRCLLYTYMSIPITLNAKSKAIYKRLSKLIEIDESNIDSLTILSDLISRYHECQAEIDKHGIIVTSSTGVIRQNPATSYQLKLVPQIRALFSELGLYDQAGDADPIQTFLGG